MGTAMEALQEMYDERYAELGRVMDARRAMGAADGGLTEDERRIWERRGEQIEYLFGCLDGLRNAMGTLDPKLRATFGWRNFTDWESSLPERSKVAP